MNDTPAARDHTSDRKLLMFLDSAETGDWERWLPLGFFHGVTTNPLLLEKAGQACTVANLHRLALRATELGAREIQLQTWGDTPAAMADTGRALAACGEKGREIVIKIPATGAGFQAGRILGEAGLRITMTAVYTTGQVMCAAGLGADYAAPYVGRLEDAGLDGSGTVIAMQDILRGTSSTTRLLTASLRSAAKVTELAGRGLDTFTFGPAVAGELLAAELTDRAAADFRRAASAMKDGK